MKRFIKSVILLMFIFCFKTEIHAETTYTVPSDNSFKAFMDYRTITSTGSKQYKLQELCSTDSLGLRVCDGRYTVAIGTGYKAPVGTYIDVLLEDGTVLPCIVGDIKQDCHTNATNMYVEHNGNAVEFIVDASKLDKAAKVSGSVGSISGFQGDVVSISTYVTKEEAEADTYTVVNKYMLNLKDVNVYMVEVIIDDTTVTVEVTEKEFNSLTVNTSKLSVK